MGVYNVIIVTYKKGLLKKLFDEEKRKQYLDSHIDDGKYYKNSNFCRGSGFKYSYFKKDYDSDEDKSIYKYNTTKKYKFHIQITQYSKSWQNNTDCIDSGHSFVYFPKLRKLHIENVGGRYNWNNPSNDDKKLIKYFTNILNELCPQKDIWFKDWSVDLTGDEYKNHDEVDNNGDELDEDEVIYEIPEELRTPLEQTRIVARFGPQSKDSIGTIEDAVFQGKNEELENYIRNNTYNKETLMELLYTSCIHKHTSCVNTLLLHGEIVSDNKVLSISIKNNDYNTAKLILHNNIILVPSYEDIANSAFEWKKENTSEELFYLLLDIFGKRSMLKK